MTHGGKRKGAGRKSSGRKAYTIRMKPKTMSALKSAAKPKSVGKWLDDTCEDGGARSLEGLRKAVE